MLYIYIPITVYMNLVNVYMGTVYLDAVEQ